jgi:hypothetical protein
MNQLVSKVLFVSYYYGEGYASGIQNKRLVESLLKKGIEINVVCRYSDHKSIGIIDKINSPNFNWFNFFQNKIFPGLSHVINIAEIFWIIKVIIFYKKRFKKYNFIHIASSPFLIQFIGSYAKKLYGCKWIVQLLDPVSDNNYINSSNYANVILKKLEKSVVSSSDLVLFNNNRLLSKFTARYITQCDKFKFLHHCTYESVHESSCRNKKFTIYHSGSLYAGRKIDFLVQSLVYLRNITNSLTELEICFVGNCSKENMDIVFLNKLEDIITFRNYISFDEMNKLLMCADALLTIDALGIECNFAPSKLCEYFSFQKPIFAITPNLGVTSDVLFNTGHQCFHEGEEFKLAIEFDRILSNRNNLNKNFNKNLYKSYLPENVSMEYLNFLNKA